MTLIDKPLAVTRASGATAPGGRRAWLIVGLLTGFLIINFADKVVVGLSGVELMKDLGINAAQFGVVQSSFYWLFAVGSIGGGMLIGRVPAKWLLSATALFWVLAMLPMIWSDSYEVLIGSRVALGLAEGPATAMAIAVAHSWFTADRRTLPTSVVTAGAGLGPLIAAPLLTMLIVGHSWHAAFVALAVVGACWIPLWLAFGRWGTADAAPVSSAPTASAPTASAPTASAPTATAPTAAEPARAERAPIGALLRNRTLIGTTIVLFATYCSAAIKISWLPVYFRQGLGYDAQEAGRLVALPYGATALLLVGAGWASRALTKRGVSHRISRGLLPSVMLLLAGLSTVGYAVAGRGALNLLLVVVGASLAGAAAGVALTAVSDVVPVLQRGPVLGTLVAIYSMGGVFAPLVLGHIVAGASTAAIGYQHGLVVLGIVMVVGGVFGALLIDPTRDRLTKS